MLSMLVVPRRIGVSRDDGVVVGQWFHVGLFGGFSLHG